MIATTFLTCGVDFGSILVRFWFLVLFSGDGFGVGFGFGFGFVAGFGEWFGFSFGFVR